MKRQSRKELREQAKRIANATGRQASGISPLPSKREQASQLLARHCLLRLLTRPKWEHVVYMSLAIATVDGKISETQSSRLFSLLDMWMERSRRRLTTAACSPVGDSAASQYEETFDTDDLPTCFDDGASVVYAPPPSAFEKIETIDDPPAFFRTTYVQAHDKEHDEHFDSLLYGDSYRQADRYFIDISSRSLFLREHSLRLVVEVQCVTCNTIMQQSRDHDGCWSQRNALNEPICWECSPEGQKRTEEAYAAYDRYVGPYLKNLKAAEAASSSTMSDEAFASRYAGGAAKS